MSRSVPEWKGASDDSPIPPRVRLRILERQGNRCAVTGQEFGPKFRPEFDHIIALALGGKNEESNIQAIGAAAHREKTDRDVKAKAKGARIRKKRAGLKTTKQPVGGWAAKHFKRKIDGSVVRREK